MSRPAGKVPQDVVAIFHVSFHPTQGNIIDWSLKASESLDLTHVEFSCLPSGLHLVEEDVIYFTKDGHQGVCVFKRRQTSEHGHRGFRLSSMGILLSKSTRPRPWKHVQALKSLVHTMYASLEGRDGQEPTEEDWEPARAFYEERKLRRADLSGSGDWLGWSAELGGDADADSLESTPTLHLPHLLHVLGPSSLTLYKHILGRRRILIYTAPPVQSACILCYVAADMCFEDQVEVNEVPNPSPQTSERGRADEDLSRKVKGRSTTGVEVLGMVTLNDLDRLKEEGKTGRGWVACTTDALFLEKPSYYDLVIDLTTANGHKSTRPTFYVPRGFGPTGSPRLSVVRFTWSDVKIWTELERILQIDGYHTSICCSPIPRTSSSKSKAPAGSAWADIWRVYEDVCVICAGLWMGSWRSTSTLSNSFAQNWGSIHLDGDDYISVRKSNDSYAYVRNVGMGIEGRPELGGIPTEYNLHKRHSSHASRRSSMSLWTWGSFRGRGDSPPDVQLGEDEDEVEDEEETVEEIIRRQEKQAMTTLALLQTFHHNTLHLLSRVSSTILPFHSLSAPNPPVATLSPRDIASFELGPLSSLDTQFVEWLAEEYGDGTRVILRKGWRDLLGLVVGFG